MHDSWPTQVKDYMRRVVLPGLDRLWKITLRSMCDEFSIILCANLGSPIDEDWIIHWNRITQECSLYDWIEKTLFGETILRYVYPSVLVVTDRQCCDCIVITPYNVVIFLCLYHLLNISFCTTEMVRWDGLLCHLINFSMQARMLGFAFFSPIFGHR